MFRKILWATDGSEAADRALPAVKDLVDAPGAKLLVVHADERFVGRAGGYPVLADETDLRAKIRAQVDELKQHGIDATLKVAEGTKSPAKLIAQTARDVDGDVIVVGTRGHRPLAGVVVGSVTQQLLHIAPCPVLAVPAPAATEAAEAEKELATRA